MSQIARHSRSKRFLQFAMLTAFLLTAAIALPFSDDFESGLGKWEINGAPWFHIEASADSAHGRVLVMDTAGDTWALARGSEKFGNARIEGDVLFPTDDDNYMGVIYNFRETGKRADFGLIYIKGNGSYLWANPHRDSNVSRLLYPEYQLPLTGDSAIANNRWQHFKVEVVGREAHFYVGDMTTPRMTFPHFEFEGGKIGLQPRCCGGSVWLDNIRITQIDDFSYRGPRVPDLRYDAASLITSWQVFGPFPATNDAAGREPSKFSWRPFATDSRGAVITARVVDYLGPNTAAYFRTRVKSDRDRDAELVLSTADDLALWVNGRFRTFASRGDAAWFDFATNPEHKPRRIPIRLKRGENDLVLRVRGGISATGGFYARVE